MKSVQFLKGNGLSRKRDFNGLEELDIDGGEALFCWVHGDIEKTKEGGR